MNRIPFIAALVLSVAAAIGMPLAAHAEQPTTELTLVPVATHGGYFDVIMKPGEIRQLQVKLVNRGSSSVEARAYAADVYTTVDGGYGAKRAGAERTGATTWLDFPTDVTGLAAGSSQTRDVTVSVPSGAEPGQYIASLVLESTASGSGGIAQETRAAVAVSIRVPGAMHAAVTVGQASRSGGRLVVALSNQGDERLEPKATMVARNAMGRRVWTKTIRMGSFYAHTAARLEAPLPASLDSGTFTVDVTLTDAAHHVSVTRVGLAVGASTSVTHTGTPLSYLLMTGTLALLLATIVIAAIVIRGGRTSGMPVEELP